MRLNLTLVAAAFAAFAGTADARPVDSAATGTAYISQPVIASPFAASTAINLGGQNAFARFSATGVAVDAGVPAPTGAHLFGSDEHRLGLHDFNLKVDLADGIELGFGYHTALPDDLFDPGAATAGLISSRALSSAAFAASLDGANYASVRVPLGRGVTVGLAHASLAPYHPEYDIPVFSSLAQLNGALPLASDYRASATMASINWDVTGWAGLALTASQTSQSVGAFGSDLLTGAKSADTSALGISARVGFGDGWVTTISYSEGISQLDLRPSLAESDTLRSRGYSIAVAKHGLFNQNDSLGLSLSRPLQLYTSTTGTDAGAGAGQELKIDRQHDWLATGTPETDVELGYVTTFFDGALALQANAGYQMNVSGQKGNNGASVLSRAKVNF